LANSPSLWEAEFFLEWNDQNLILTLVHVCTEGYAYNYDDANLSRPCTRSVKCVVRGFITNEHFKSQSSMENQYRDTASTLGTMMGQNPVHADTDHVFSRTMRYQELLKIDQWSLIINMNYHEVTSSNILFR